LYLFSGTVASDEISDEDEICDWNHPTEEGNRISHDFLLRYRDYPGRSLFTPPNPLLLTEIDKR
jgi:hypothetical protein